MLPLTPFIAARSLYAGLSVLVFKLKSNLTGVTAATDTITKTAHGLAVNDAVQFISGTGFTGLTANGYYYVINVPDADTFKISATPGGTALTPGTSSAGVFAPVTICAAAELDDDPQREDASIKRPDALGILRDVRVATKSESEGFKFALDEPKRLLDIFGGAMSGRKDGTCTAWIPDPSDASGKVALKSEADWSCTVTRDGSMKFGGGDFTKSPLVVKSTKAGAITWTADASA